MIRISKRIALIIFTSTFSCIAAGQSPLKNFTIKVQVIDSCNLTTDTSSRCFGLNATGFFFRFNDADLPIVIVVNKSILEHAQLLNFTFSNIGDENLKPIKNFSFAIGQLTIYRHPTTDLAAIELRPILQVLQKRRINIDYSMITENNIYADSIKNFYSFYEELFVMGYPVIKDERNYVYALCRRGIAATPYYDHFNDNPTFLADVQLSEGFRGSPALVNTIFLKRSSDLTSICIWSE